MNEQKIKMHYDPKVAVSDIEVWLSCSYRTAQRRLAAMRADLGKSGKWLPTISQAREYFC